MNKILDIFGHKAFLPVIHYKSTKDAWQSAYTCMEAGADGIFLINQGASVSNILKLARDIKDEYGIWIGVNLLGYPAEDAIDAFRQCDAIDSIARGAAINALWQDTCEQKPDFNGLYFGGVAFKYQEEVPDDEQPIAAMKALTLGVDIVTTSGPGTGQAPDKEKVKRIKFAIGDSALALASGISCENVSTFLPWVDAFLVASSIEREFGVLDRDKTVELSKLIHEYKRG